CPAHVLLHIEHAALGLDIEAAGIEAHALADQGDLRSVRIAPDDVDEPGCASGGASDRVDEREVLGDEIIAGHRAHGCTVAMGEGGRNKSLLGSPSASSANKTPARAPSAEGSRRCRPGLGSNPQASAKARVRESRPARRSRQLEALTKVTGMVGAIVPRGRNI